MKKGRFFICVFMLGLSLVGGASCFASGGGWVGDGSVDHGHVPGGNVDCDQSSANLACFGYSWVFYKSLVSASEATEVKFRPYGEVTIPKECAEHEGGGFWHFGRNARGFLYESGFGPEYNFAYFSDFNYVLGQSSNKYTYSTSRGSWGHFETYNYGDLCKGNFSGTNRACYQKHTPYDQKLYNNKKAIYAIDNSKDSGSESSGYISNVLNDYKKAYKYINNGQEYAGNDLPGNLYAFCYWEGMDNRFYSDSSVALNPKAQGTLQNWDHTGIISEGQSGSVEYGTLTVNVGDEVDITFSHKMYASQVTNNADWKVQKSYPNNGYNNVNAYAGAWQGKVNLDKQVGAYYTGGKDFTGEGSNKVYYVLRHTDKVKFTAPGEYRFCESLTINNANSPITTACAKIVVKDIEYYARSNVGGGGSFETTHKVSEYTTKTMDFGTIATGDSKEIVFSHNIYSSAPKNGASWSVDREWTNDDVNSTANLTVPTEEGYVPSVLGYSDGTYSFVLRDVYNFQFDNPGTYEYCETLTLENKKLTRVCAKITVVAPQYAAESNIAVKYYTFNTTGIFSDTSNAPKTIANITLGDPTKEQVDYDIPYLKVGQTTPLTFSHRIYSSFERAKDKYTWTIKRDFDYCTNANGCKILARVNTVNNTGDSGTSSSEINITGNSEWQRALNYKDGSWYKTNDSDMPFRDSGEAGHGFNWRDIYWLTLNKVGDYSGKICEYVSIPGSNHILTKACASVKVPYNFKNSTLVELEGNGEVGAGGIVKVKTAKITVGAKCNEAARENTEAAEKKKKGEYVPCDENSNDEYKYATQVDDATVRLIAYQSNNNSGEAVAGYGNYGSDLCYGKANCNVIYNKNGEPLNSVNNDLSGKIEDVEGIMNSTYTANAPVGSYFCVALAVYPYASGKLLNANTGTYVDTNTTPAEVNADNSWYISKPSCARVVKRPTFQVLGGSVYSAGVVKSLTTEKIVSSERKAFGSWAEQSVVANGAVVKFASGAALSKGSDPDFCRYQVPLTFANSGCSSNQAGSADIAANTSGRDAITNYWWLDNPVKNTTSWEEGTSNGGSKLKYKYSDGDITFNGMSNISGDATYVIRSENGNIYINGNIEYANGPYNMASQIPKMLIYANNIYIKCDVQRVDAILMAKSMINTCAKNDSSLYNNSDKNDVNNPNRATTQLTVNGILMAEQILFDRTYGGDGHIEGEGGVNTPAEIVNYDTSAVIWGREEVTDDIDDSFKIIYQQELAPRY